MNNYRKLGQEIAPYLALKFYHRDIPNNTFYKKCSDKYFDVNEIRFQDEYVIISNIEYNICHKTKIKNLIDWKSLNEFWNIFNNYIKMQKKL